MSERLKVNPSAAELCAWYGDGLEGASPTLEQWQSIVLLPEVQPITLVNFFKFRSEAVYQGARGHKGAVGGKSISGREAFQKYSAVSVPTMARIGGSFLHAGTFAGTMVGHQESWDLVVVASYTGLQALLDLYADPDYREAYSHRSAACERQKVVLCQ